MTVHEIRQRCQASYYSDFHERLSRTFSPYLTYIFIKLGFSANGVTYLSIVFGLAGALMLLLNNSVWWFASPVFLVLASLMDHCDGELARWRGQASLTGLFMDRLYPIIVHPVTFGAILVRLFIDDPSVWYFVIGLTLMWLANMPRILNAYVFLCFSDGLFKPKKVGVRGDSPSKLERQSEQVHIASESNASLLSRVTYPLIFLLAKGTGIALSILILVILERTSITILGIRPFAVYVTGYTFAFLVVSLKYAVSAIRDQRPDMVYRQFQDKGIGEA